MVPIDGFQTILLEKEHVPQAMTLSREAGWNQVSDDWELFIAEGKVFGVFDGRTLVGTAAVLPYDTHAAWIGMVLVRMSYQRKGIGKRLLKICIEQVRTQSRTAYLDATPAGQLLYESLGFEREFSITRWELAQDGKIPQLHVYGETSALTPDAIERIIALDEAVMGMRRCSLMKSLCMRATEDARIMPDGSGFVLRRVGDRALQIGPLVSNNQSEAIYLLNLALEQDQGLTFIDVADGNARVEETLLERGFVIQRRFLRMRLGQRMRQGDGSRLFAISGPEFG